MPAKLLVLDRSARARRLVREGLSGAPDVQVVCDTEDVDVALEALLKRRPDALCVDLSFSKAELVPLLDTARARSLVVIGLREPLGPGHPEMHAVLLRPAVSASSDHQAAQYRVLLEPLLRRLRTRRAPEPPSVAERSRQATTPVLAPARVVAPGVPSVLLVGASSGGPEALNALLPSLPDGFPLPVLVVQHMPAGITRMLAERLHRRCALPVREAEDGDVPAPGVIHIAAGGHHLEAVREAGAVVLRLNGAPPVHSCRPAVDVLFSTAARAFVGPPLAVVLTGMGRDGVAGAQSVRDVGGEVYAQDEQSSVVWGMPGAVVRRRLADRVLPLSQMSGAILQRCWPQLVGVGP